MKKPTPYKRLENHLNNIDLDSPSAINLLGNNAQSARIGAIYLLYNLAFKEERYRNTVVELLLHIRNITQEKIYQKEHKDRPSHKIGITMDLLFSKKVDGLYPYFHKDWDKLKQLQNAK